MSVEKLTNNILEIRKTLIELKKVDSNMRYADVKQRPVYNSTYNSLFSRLVMLNNAIPQILNEISGAKKLTDSSSRQSKTESYLYSSNNSQKNFVTLNKEDKEKFVKELSLSEQNMKKVSSSKTIEVEKPSSLARYANKFFGKLTEKVSQSHFQDLKKDLKDSNSRFLLPTYLAIAIFVSLGILLGSAVFFILVGLIFPSAWAFIWAPAFLCFISAISYYFYPSLEKGSLTQRISNELPFATIYMSAIAGSNIEPTHIFKIIASNPEYKNVAIEIRKVVNQVEIYGYDLVNALRNVAKSTPNEKLAELLGGMATNIVSGGSLKNYLEKKSENLLTDYKLEREKYNTLAATFMDIYISVLITAPLILVMMIVIMSVTGFNLGLTPNFMIGLAVSLVALINVFFLIFLQIKQPK